VLPGGVFAHAVPRGKQITTWEKTLYDEWLPETWYKRVPIGDHHFQLQVYEEGRFKGVGDLLEESEIDVYVPIVHPEVD
jgi:predicted transcriptional regulator YdeE